MTTTHSLNLRLIALSVAVMSVMLSYTFISVPRAEARSVSELSGRITSLRAQIDELRNLLNSRNNHFSFRRHHGSSGGGQDSDDTDNDVCPYEWTRNLRFGSRGEDVKKLQQFLNQDPDTIVRKRGIGSPGRETIYYGPGTGRAVAKFQEKYAIDILSKFRLKHGTWYFGDATREKANSLCVGDDGDPTDPGETMIDISPKEPNVPIGMVDAPLFAVDVTANETFVLEEIEVAFKSPSADSEAAPFPWDTFGDVSVWNGSTKLGDVSADSESDWSVNEDGMSYSVVIKELSVPLSSDESTELVVAASVNSAAEVGIWKFWVREAVVTPEDGGELFHLPGSAEDIISVNLFMPGLGVELSEKSAEAIVIADEEGEGDQIEFVFNFEVVNDTSVDVYLGTDVPWSFASENTASGQLISSNLSSDSSESGDTTEKYFIEAGTAREFTFTLVIEAASSGGLQIKVDNFDLKDPNGNDAFFDPDTLDDFISNVVEVDVVGLLVACADCVSPYPEESTSTPPVALCPDCEDPYPTELDPCSIASFASEKDWIAACGDNDIDDTDEGDIQGTEVQAIGVYDAADSLKSGPLFSSYRRGSIDVDVSGLSAPTILVLSGYKEITWDITGTNDNLTKILTTGYRDQHVTGTDAPVTTLPGRTYAYDEDSSKYRRLNALIERETGRSIDTFQGAREGSSFSVTSGILGTSTSSISELLDGISSDLKGLVILFKTS